MSRKIQRWVAGAISAAVMIGVGAAMAPSAMAISSDYCGYGRAAGEPFCFEGSGYRGWRYHQASTGSQGPLINLCVRAYTGSYYRVNACSNPANFVANTPYCSAEPTTNSSVGWFGSGSSKVIYGHADSRTDGCSARRATNSGTLPEEIAERLSEPETAARTGVSPATARVVASGEDSQLFRLGGDAQECVVLVTGTGFSAGCTTAEQIAKTGQLLSAELKPEGGYRVSGLLGGEKASVATADGGEVPVSASGAGAFIIDTKSPPVSVTVSGSRGTSTTPLMLGAS